MKEPIENIHYLCHPTGNGTKIFEWISRETGTVKKWEGSLWNWRIMWADDVTTLPEDYIHA